MSYACPWGSLTLTMLVSAALCGATAPRQVVAADAGPRTEPAPLANYQRILYVSAAGQPAHPAEGSRERPFAELRRALESIQNAGPERRYAILVAEGRYPVVDLSLKEHVDLFGGFDANDWSRDILKNKTVLDARQEGRVLIGANHAQLDGFTVTGGRVRAHGGAVFCRDTSPTLTNNVFVANSTQVPKGYDLTRLHQGGNGGGAILIEFNSVPIVANNVFVDNSTEIGDGGAIYCYEAVRSKDKLRPRIQHNVFLANRTGVLDPDSTTRSSNGGAIACSRGAAPAISDNIFVGNLVGDGSDAGAVYCAYGAKPSIQNNRIVGNRAGDDGGGLYAMKTSEPIVDGNIFAGNWTTKGGAGGVRLSKEGRALITNNLFAHHPSGDAIACAHSWMTCANNTIVQNQRGGISYGNDFSYFRPSIIRNNLIHGNVAGGIQINRKAKGPLPEIFENDVQGASGGDGNIDVPPKFLDDGLTGRIAAVETTGLTSVLTIAGGKLPAGELVGRVICVGEKWTVVRENEATRLTVWGDMTTDREGRGSPAVREFSVIPTYTQTADSPARSMGARLGH